MRGPDRTIQFPRPFGERARVRGSGRTESYIAPGGIDSLRSPYGQPVRYALSLSNWLRQLSNPQSRGLIPPAGVQHAKKSPYLRTSSSLNMAVREGLTRCARPTGSLFATLSVCPTGCASCRTLSRGFSSLPLGRICEKKARTFVRALSQIWR